MKKIVFKLSIKKLYKLVVKSGNPSYNLIYLKLIIITFFFFTTH